MYLGNKHWYLFKDSKIRVAKLLDWTYLCSMRCLCIHTACPGKHNHDKLNKILCKSNEYACMIREYGRSELIYSSVWSLFIYSLSRRAQPWQITENSFQEYTWSKTMTKLSIIYVSMQYLCCNSYCSYTWTPESYMAPADQVCGVMPVGTSHSWSPPRAAKQHP